MRVAINGFGRIGRTVLKLCLENKIDVVAINDVHGTEDARYLLQYDTIYGKYKHEVKTKDTNLIVNKKTIKVLSERDPLKLPWKQLGVDLVIESTGAFRKREELTMHLKSGAKYVVLTAPGKGEDKPDLTVVPGVNHSKLNKNHQIVSVASCTTNCLVPLVKVLHDKFKIKRAMFTTVHAYTNDQVIQDGFHKKVRRGRAAAQNMVPTTTGAADSVVEIMPDLLGRITGLAVRVPVAVGSLVDLTAELDKVFDTVTINDSLKKASQSSLKGILEYSEDEIVSSDVIGNPHSTIFDARSTQIDGNLVKVLAWYDNEFGYSSRVVDVLKMMKKWVK